MAPARDTQRVDDRDANRIIFEQIATEMGRLMQELASPEARKNLRVPPDVAAQLRQHQIARIEENIAILRRKQDEFNRRMQDYIDSLQKLLDSFERDEKGAASAEAAESGEGAARASSADAGEPPGGTCVRCIGCGSQESFEQVHVLVAMEPEDYLASPTEVIVQRHGQLQKGFFKCPQCGGYNMTIRPF